MNILTFDIEEWYTYRHKEPGGEGRYVPALDSYLDMLLDKLDERGFKATFFCLGIIAREYPHVVRRISDRGHETGCHSDAHRWLGELSPEEFAADTKRALDSLAQVAGTRITSYRAPAFSVGRDNLWIFDILADNGIKNDCSIFPAGRYMGGFPGFGNERPCMIHTGTSSVNEFPVPTSAVFGKRTACSGGGYLRVLPYPIVKRLVDRQEYSMTYLHIRDFDTGQKKIISPRYLQSYYGLSRAWAKVCRLLDDFEFVNVRQASAAIDWSAALQVTFNIPAYVQEIL